MSTAGLKQDPDAGAAKIATSATPASTAAPTPVAATNMSAGTPVQTYPSPAHAQWAASQMVIDPQLQQQSATPKPQQPVTTQTTTTPSQAAAQAYYSYASHYPQHYTYQQYMTQAQAVSLAHQQHSASPLPTGVAATHRTSFSVATTPAPLTPVTAAHIPAAVAAASAAATATASTTANNSTLDTSDIATLNDALGSAGVDLRAEEESLQRQIPAHLQPTTSIYMQSRQYEDRSRKQAVKPAFNTQNVGTTMRAIGAEHKVPRIPEDSVNYMALALRARMQDLITAMIEASRYRKEAQFDRPASVYGETQTPMWSILVRSDVAKQLAVLERVEREDELKIRRERKERLEMAAQHTANLAAQANGAMLGIEGPGSMGMGGGMGGGGDDDSAPKKKKKKDGPGVTARNMSEDVRKKMSNAVATQAAGLGKYSWMTATANSSPAPKKAAATPANAGSGSGASSWARPYVPKKPQPEKTTPDASPQAVEEDPSKITVTMRDAVFVIEKERGHGGGRGSARGWK